MKSLLQQLSWFVVVGCAAAATHWLCAVGCVAWLQVQPFLANFLGWSVAVFVSFLGHYFLTFRHQEKKLLPAVIRFVAISAGGFLINELAFVTLLRVTTLPYYWLLAMILLVIAFMTFALSRYWAFRHTA